MVRLLVLQLIDENMATICPLVSLNLNVYLFNGVLIDSVILWLLT